MTLKLTLNDFSGPLELLLSLLDEKKVHITDITLSDITDQYIEYLNTLSEEREEELADFLIIATKLLLLKSRALLPHLFPEEEADGESLKEQLRLYRKFLEASKRLNNIWETQSYAFFRLEPPQRSEEVFLPKKLTLDQLHRSMVQLRDRLKPSKPLLRTHIGKTVSLKEKINEIHAFLKKKRQVSFFGCIHDKTNRSEVIVGFLALLELVKQHHVGITQDSAFGDIVIRNI
jgi:segregation and condensation protein A